MAQQTIGIGTVANDGTGDFIRDAFDKCNGNFTELYAGLTGLLDFKGSTDCSANPNYPAASKGDFYLVSVAGKIGGASGLVVEAGDSYFATADNAGGTQASVGASWTVVQGNITSYMPKSGGTFTGDIEVPADAYDATGWNGNNEAPTKNDVRDKIEAVIAGAVTVDNDTTLAGDSSTAVPSQHAVKTAIAAAVAGLSWKQAVRAATTVTGTLASAYENGDTIDGVVLATGDRILIKNQSSAAENGIYTVNASGAPTRATDADSGAELVNASVYVSEGTTLADTQWTCTTNATITVGSTSLAFAQLTSSGGFTAASTTEQLTGTDSAKGSTSDSVAALWEQGADVASAGTTSLGEGGYFNITGTTTITDIDFGTDKAGRKAWVKFAGILTLTHNSSTLILPTGANITTAAGDTACFVSEGSDVVRCVAYQKASGAALVGGGGSGNVFLLQFGPLNNEPPSSVPATVDTRNGHPTLDFDAGTDESAIFSARLPSDYGGTGLSAEIFWSATSATSGDVVWNAAIERMDLSTLDIDADSFAAVQAATTTAPGTSGMVVKTTITFSSGAQMDSLAAGEMFRIKITRNAANGSDTMTGDAELLLVTVKAQ